MQINRKSQIDRVVAVQGLTRAEAADRVNTRIYEAHQYLKARGSR